MLKVPIKDGNVDKALKTLKLKVRKVKQVELLREREYYEKPSVKKRAVIKTAIFRQMKNAEE